MTTSSAGISIKDILNNSQNEPLDVNSGFHHSNLPSSEDQLDSCFYDLCTKKKSCGGYVVCGKFKSSINSLLCFFFTFMTFCLFLSVIGPVILYKLADEEVNTSVVVDSPSAPAYDLWVGNVYGQGFEDIKIQYDLHFFDCQNVEEAQTGSKPVLVEVGPYAYDEYFVKFDIQWTDDGDTVSFYTYRYYIFNQERTGPGLKETDTIRMPYPSVAGFQYILKEVPVSYEELVAEDIYKVLVLAEQAADRKLQILSDQIDASPNLNAIERAAAHRILNRVQGLSDRLFSDLFTFANQSNPLDLLLKKLMCGTPYGVSLFYSGQPSIAWFGNVADPLLLGVSAIVKQLEAKSGKYIPWTASVPANSWNWSSYEDVTRRRMPDVYKTGKKNPKQIGQYVSYNNMKIFHNCVSPMDSQDPNGYVEGKEFPSCQYYDPSWNESVAEDKGYVRPFASDWANRIEGTDGNTYGRPVTTQNIQIFSYDIYRSGYMGYRGDNYDWHGVKLRRYGVREKDMYNVSLSPQNADYYAFGWSGVENLTICQNLPVFVSFPHFYLADPRYVSSVVGLSPNALSHDTYVDIEPQTGMLARAMKRIQVSYQLFDTHLPELDQSTVDTADYFCGNLSSLSQFLPVPTCNVTIPLDFVQCMDQPSTWSFNGGNIMIPMGWVQESVVMPQSSADELNDLFLVDDVATQMRFWSLVIAGVCAAMIALLFYNEYEFEKRRGIDKSLYHRIDANHTVGNPTAPLLPSDSATSRF